MKSKRVSTFQEFESNTSDAWDAGEDDDELLAMATESLNSEVVMETAHRVLRNHSQRQSQPSQKKPEPQPEPQPIAEPPVVSSGDLRLVKSVSESHTPCPSGREEGTVEPRKEWTVIKRAVCLTAPGLWAVKACVAIFRVDMALPGPGNSLAARGLQMVFSLFAELSLFVVFPTNEMTRLVACVGAQEEGHWGTQEMGDPRILQKGARSAQARLPWVRVLSLYLQMRKQIHSSLRPP